MPPRPSSSTSSTSGHRRRTRPSASSAAATSRRRSLARELSFEPRVVVFNKPTHGLDVRTIALVRERIRTLADRGVATIVISTDLDELVDLCDRVAVLFEGRIAGIVPNGPVPRPASASSSWAATATAARPGGIAAMTEPTAARIEDGRGLDQAPRPLGDARRQRRALARPHPPRLADLRHPAGGYRARPVRVLPGHRRGGPAPARRASRTPSRRMAPILLIGAGLIVAFRGSLWNLGGNGQYLLAFAVVAGIAPRHAVGGADGPRLDRGVPHRHGRRRRRGRWCHRCSRCATASTRS